MLTTTIDGLWVLQVLTGIETLPPELGLRPILPRVETKEVALRHPMAAELRAAGVIDDAGEVDAAVVEWLTVLSRRDIALIMYVTTPVDPGVVGVLLARFAQWWVVMERTEDVVRIGPAGTAIAEDAANMVVRGQIDRLCGALPAADMRPVTLNVDTIVESVTSPDTLRRYLSAQQVDVDQMRLLMLATDTSKSVSASIVAVQVEAGRSHIEHGSVTIYDTPEGRLLAEHAPQGGTKWMIVGPGTMSNITTAINTMLRRLPANDEWFSYRKII